MQYKGANGKQKSNLRCKKEGSQAHGANPCK